MRANQNHAVGAQFWANQTHLPLASYTLRSHASHVVVGSVTHSRTTCSLNRVIIFKETIERYGPWPKKHMNLFLSSPGWAIIAPTRCRTLDRILNDIWIGPNVFVTSCTATESRWCQHDTTFNLYCIIRFRKSLPNIHILCLWYTELKQFTSALYFITGRNMTVAALLKLERLENSLSQIT